MLRWIFFVFLGCSFIACENEPLEGEFIVDDGSEGAFTAVVDGETFSASTTSAQMNDGALIISGIDGGGNVVALTFGAVGECTYDLSSINSFGVFATSATPDNPFSSVGISGGSGSATIIDFNVNGQTVSGAFSFNGIREVTDGNGNTSTEVVVITEGIFNSIPFEVISGEPTTVSCDEINGGGGSGGDPVLEDPEDSFYALVDGEEFVDISFVSEVIVVGGENVIKVLATNDIGAKVEFFIPESLGVGTFEMQSIFDGATLVGSYSDGETSENLTSNPGTITFTEFSEITGKLNATFSFTATDPLGSDPTVVEITQGEFNIDYKPDSGTAENVFIATIDGEDYVPTSIDITKQPINGVFAVNLTTQNADTNQGVSLSFPLDIEVGSYAMAPFQETGNEKVGIYNPNIGSSILFKSDENGTLTINSYQYSNGVVVGSFSYVASDPLDNDMTTYEVIGSFVITIP